ncbi:xanthine dehydrogenase accessory protein XdhC [Herbaspirillum sp. YR522]|uniref:xanthine dehydrogenase accessory protein XdhC n=1 Tax=Herbaspirillum sp. YR522 TaxID=1144342 RepID=UPI00026FC486|nr:xanthine dehydrogenase accessory protein XdhC [Herbaspirillum sp. YR522]EJN08603.1 xanthine dehydrogenase accessory protein XdhC [Herbaspirillum sp. YR522]
MSTWLAALERLQDRAEAAVLVSVVATRGSAPREPGARMVYSAQAQFDTIGGGHLEWRAAAIARDMLLKAPAPARLERIALGPSLGQCCGGVVTLSFELVAPGSTRELANWAAAEQIRQQALPQVVLFGAGHVGAAIVHILRTLPCRVLWVDEREDMFPPGLAPQVTIEATDVPNAAVDLADSGAYYLVMTHSHALDQQLAERILRRDDIAWFGLIGSLTKRRQFEHRLQARGYTAAQLDRITCPIGIDGIDGKEPASIALAVAAQLMQLWQRRASTDARPHADSCLKETP